MNNRHLISTIIIFLSFTVISAQEKNMVWNDPQSSDFPVINGQGWTSELRGTYNRFPARCEKTIRKAVWNLSKQSAGLYIKFKTDSPVIKVRYGVSGDLQMVHMPATGVSGVDLYSRDENDMLRWYATRHDRAFKDTILYTYKNLSYITKDPEGYEFTLYLPLYNRLEWMEIGVKQNASFRFLPSAEEKPIVIYGTSIAQGALCTRPGMAWTNIIQRNMNTRVVNLGFSGNGQMEPEVFTILSELDASVFVIDCMANMDKERIDSIYNRTVKGIRILRSRTDAPIILTQHAGFSNMNSSESTRARAERSNVELEKAYRALKGEGVRNLYLIPHAENAYTIDEMVEGIHPNDIGMMHQAEVTMKYIRKATRGKK